MSCNLSSVLCFYTDIDDVITVEPLYSGHPRTDLSILIKGGVLN